MLTVLFVSLLAVILALFSRNDKKALLCAFVILTAFWALRYNWGNDYMQYLSHYKSIKSYNMGLFDISGYDQIFVKRDYLWYILNNLFSNFGFFGLIIVLSLVENFIIYRFVVNYVPPKWYWLSVFIYCFNIEFYLIGASMMRQWLALCLFVYAINFLLDKRIIPYLIISIIAIFIHFSAIVMLLCIPFAYIKNLKIGNKYLVLLFGFLLIWYIMAPLYLRDYAYLFYELNDQGAYSNYEMTNMNDKGLSFFGIISNYFIPLTGFLMLYLNGDLKTKILASIFILQLIFVPLGSVMPIFGRITTYFTSLGIVVWPLVIYEMLKRKYSLISISILCLLLLINIRGYIGFFSDSIWEKSFSTYTTILTQEWQ